jgi:phosphoglycerate dehydrogenase-like enzyme
MNPAIRVGVPEDTPAALLQAFPTNGIDLIRLPNNLTEPVAIDFWIPPSFGWIAANMLPYLRGLRVVQSLMAGVDWILPKLPQGVTLCDGRGLHDIPVAEWVLGAILASLKRFPEYRDHQREQVWAGQKGQRAQQASATPPNSPLPYLILGDELHGKTVLILGYGSIGAAVEHLLNPFSVTILRAARTARQGVSAMKDLPALLQQADVVVVLVPLTPETRGMIGAAVLQQMKPGALLINAARGPVVATDALVEALQAGRIHAVVDVTDPEPLPPGHPLWTAPNCFITPHVAGSVEAFAGRAYQFAAAQVQRYAAGEPLENQVSEAGY